MSLLFTFGGLCNVHNIIFRTIFNVLAAIHAAFANVVYSIDEIKLGRTRARTLNIPKMTFTGLNTVWTLDEVVWVVRHTAGLGRNGSWRRLRGLRAGGSNLHCAKSHVLLHAVYIEKFNQSEFPNLWMGSEKTEEICSKTKLCYDCNQLLLLMPDTRRNLN